MVNSIDIGERGSGKEMTVPLDTHYTSQPSNRVSSDYLAGANLGFEMASHLVGASSHLAMTSTFLGLLLRFPGVKSATCYEVFEVESRQSGQDPWLFRRFPLTLEDNYEDENTRAIVAMLFNRETKTLIGQYQGRDIILLRVDDVSPKRIVFIEGALNGHYLALVKGLYSVYAKQTSLLDTKERDSLTHLLNRQSLELTLAQVQQHHRDQGLLVGDGLSWLAVLDIDHFKNINDTYGHIFGDEILIHFANLLNDVIRFSDFLFRFGGEEFIIILNHSDDQGASLSLERFRRAIQEYDFPSGEVTASIGYTIVDPNKSVEQLLEEADKAVYAAKSAGRNTVVRYHNIIAADNIKNAVGDIELF